MAQYLYLLPAIALAACSTVQENPNYQYSSKYGQVNTDFADANGSDAYGASSIAASTSTRVASNTRTAPANTITLDEYCMEKNRNRQLIGAGVGGAIGALAGDAIGGTKATIAGAAIGGTAGYAAGDATLDCRRATYSGPTASSPTDQAYNADQMMGTPGYQLYLQEQAAAVPVSQQAQTAPAQYQAPYSAQNQYQVPASNAPQTYRAQHDQTSGYPSRTQPQTQIIPSGPRVVDYDYSQNTITAGGPVGATVVTQPVPKSAPVPAPAPTPAQRYSASAVAGPLMTGNYVVRQGDTVYSLSRRLCVPVVEFSQINGLGSDYAIKIDQPLILPPSRC